MFCGKCGNQVPEGHKFCSKCGTAVDNPAPDYQQAQYTQYQPDYQSTYEPSFTATVQPVYTYPMKWYNFLVYFALFASAVVNCINAITFFTGSVYNVNGENISEYVYEYFDGLQFLDIIYGLGCIAMAGLAIYARQLLVKYSANGPKMISYLYIAGIALSIIYLIGFFAITEADIDSDAADMISSVFISLASSVVMIVVNKAYFDKRAELFVN